jgi:hypothetical protein
MLSFIPCWKIKQCPADIRDACPAFGQHNGPCWTMSAKPWNCRSTDCRTCPAYTTVADCTSIKRIISDFMVSPEHPSENPA